MWDLGVFHSAPRYRTVLRCGINSNSTTIAMIAAGGHELEVANLPYRGRHLAILKSLQKKREKLHIQRPARTHCAIGRHSPTVVPAARRRLSKLSRYRADCVTLSACACVMRVRASNRNRIVASPGVQPKNETQSYVAKYIEGREVWI